MRLSKKSISKVTLSDLLKRRRTDLRNFLSSSGIVSYELLKTRCHSMGVTPPSVEEFSNATGTKLDGAPDVSSPAEGIIVVSAAFEEKGESSALEHEVVQNDNESEAQVAAPEGQSLLLKKKKRRAADVDV